MSPHRLRTLDRFLGAPVLALLGLLRRLSAPWRRAVGYPEQAAGSRGQGVVVIQLSEMGSTLVAEPALRALAARKEIRAFVTLARNAEVLALVPWLPRDRVWVLRDHHLGVLALDALALVLRCRRQRPEGLVDLELFSRFSAVLAGLSGAPLRAGFDGCGTPGLSRGGVFNRPLWYNTRVHMSQNYQGLVEALLNAESSPYWRSPPARQLPRPTPFPRSASAEAEMLRRMSQHLEVAPEVLSQSSLVLFQVGAGQPLEQRNWPRSHWIALARALVRDPECRVLLNGRREEAAEAEAIRAGTGFGCYNICGLFQVAELPHLFRRARLLVASDSGVAHFAAVTDMPTLVLFGPETPQLFRPLSHARVLSAGLACSPCLTAANRRTTRCRRNLCMEHIEPARVLQEIRLMLNRVPVAALPWDRAAEPPSSGQLRNAAGKEDAVKGSAQ